MSLPTPMRLPEFRELPRLLRGEPGFLRSWISRPSWRSPAASLSFILLGAGAFGAAIGAWHAPLQALYSGIKLPLVLLATAAANGLINGLLAPLLGLDLRLRESLAAVLASFAVCAAILGALAPVLLFLTWNSPPLGTPGAGTAHSFILLSCVTALGVSGLWGNLRLYQTLKSVAGPDAGCALRVVIAWIGTNLFLGSQISWILRPFVGSPGLAIEFIRPDALQGSFYESVFRSLRNLLGV